MSNPQAAAGQGGPSLQHLADRHRVLPVEAQIGDLLAAISRSIDKGFESLSSLEHFSSSVLKPQESSACHPPDDVGWCDAGADHPAPPLGMPVELPLA